MKQNPLFELDLVTLHPHDLHNPMILLQMHWLFLFSQNLQQFSQRFSIWLPSPAPAKPPKPAPINVPNGPARLPINPPMTVPIPAPAVPLAALSPTDLGCNVFLQTRHWIRLLELLIVEALCPDLHRAHSF